MDVIRWPYRSNMVIRSADGSLATYRIQWQYASVAAKPLPYPHAYGSSNYNDPQDIDMGGVGEIVETGRVRNRRVSRSLIANAFPCPDSAALWNAQAPLE